MDPVAELLARLTGTRGGAWPPPADGRAWAAVRRARAFADHDRDRLAALAGWDDRRTGRRYRVDPLADRIRQGWADYLFGDDLTLTAASETDQKVLDAFVDENDLTEECHAAESDLVVPEGEAWWRIYVDADVAPDAPLVEWHSRLNVAPLFVGRRLMAAALITELDPPRARERTVVYRHLEIHADRLVEHVLFRGTRTKIGRVVDLGSHPDLEDLARVLGDGDTANGRGPVWDHGLPMLMGRIVNRRGRTPWLGVSEFASIEDQLLDLNEAASIAASNARLTARRRVVVPSSAVNPAPTVDELVGDIVDMGDGTFARTGTKQSAGASFDAGEDVLVADPVNEELGRDGTPPFKVLEYSFDAEPLIAHKRDLVETALTRIGITPQWVGVRVEGDGFAASGTALRLRLIPTDKAGRGKWRPWDAELPKIVNRAAQVSNLPEGDGGLGVPWSDPVNLPAVERGDPIPVDPVEDAQVEQALVGAGVRSRETSVRAQHPDWDDSQVADELDRIDAERPAGGGLLAAGFGGDDTAPA